VSDETIRVVIADDHAVVRQGIRGVLEELDDVEVVAEASNGEEVLALLDDAEPDLLVLDISMPEKSGLDVTKQLRQDGSEVGVLILSMHDDPEYVLEAVRAGADGYVLKDVGPAELREALRTVYGGQEYFTDRVTHQLSVALREELEEERKRSKVESLTPREKEVLLRVAKGLTNREVAEEFGISPRTVETHRERVMAKLRIRTVAGLTRFVVENELGEEEEEEG
jgi:RNA polymerase sigma factor (sigma-70 family)